MGVVVSPDAAAAAAALLQLIQLMLLQGN